MSKEIILTGIKPTGEPHFGNYLGAIQPALNLANQHSASKKLFFIADYHALTTIKDATQMARYRQVVAATWLTFFKDIPNCYFYFQSQIPETFELYWILSCVCPKGLLNRAHAYKSMVAKNVASKHDPDHNINHGLFAYPVLMAADILLFHSTKVPVGQDQKQHVEIAIEIVKNLNKYCTTKVPVPEAIIDKSVETIIGTDGQKMSKNYNNTIPLFDNDNLKKKIMKIKTDSVQLGQPLDPSTCNVFKLLSYIVSEKRLNEIKAEYLDGSIGYGQAKTYLFEEYITYFQNHKQYYDQLMVDQMTVMKQISKQMMEVRGFAKQNLSHIRQALGF